MWIELVTTSYGFLVADPLTPTATSCWREEATDRWWLSNSKSSSSSSSLIENTAASRTSMTWGRSLRTAGNKARTSTCRWTPATTAWKTFRPTFAPSWGTTSTRAQPAPTSRCPTIPLRFILLANFFPVSILQTSKTWFYKLPAAGLRTNLSQM